VDSPVGKVVVSAVYEGGAAERHGEYGRALPVWGMVWWLYQMSQESRHPSTWLQMVS
jgi:hypothetical protein